MLPFTNARLPSDVAEALRLNLVTTRERHSVIAELHTQLVAASASVTDFQQFSNVSVCLTLEWEQHLGTRIAEAIRCSGLHLAESSLRALQHSAVAANRNRMVEASLQITFIHNDPDLRIPVPAVPG